MLACFVPRSNVPKSDPMSAATSLHFEGHAPSIVTIEGETWHAILTPAEYADWDQYANHHPHLVSDSYGRTLAMFPNHHRRGINLNNPTTQ